MIVRIFSTGTSFKGLAAYLTHDPDAETDERVAWTHTLNCAFDHVPSAVSELYHTAEDAELLKQAAGIRAGGRSSATVVKHISLNWSPDDAPSREHMIAASETFLEHMGWHEHQAILVAHADKAHSHVHIVLNAVHPTTGLRFGESFERRRAQAWAAGYEQQQERIYCHQRFKAAHEREDAMPRHAWEAFREKQQAFEQDERTLHENHPESAESSGSKRPEHKYANEWIRLKRIQRQERARFFADGKAAFANVRNSVYREVRREFRARWAGYYEARKNGGAAKARADFKARIVADQKAILAARGDEACLALRSQRDDAYRGILKDQREIRAELRSRQEAGLDSAEFLAQLTAPMAASNVEQGHRPDAEAVTCLRRLERADDAMAHGFGYRGLGLRYARKLGSNTGSSHGVGFASLMQSLLGEFKHAKRLTQRRASISEASRRAMPILIPSSTNTKDEVSKAAAYHPMRPRAALFASAEPRHELPLVEHCDDGEEDRGAEGAIETEFQRKLSGLRFMPRHLRAQALKAAKQWRQLALRIIREKRAVVRQDRKALARLRAPAAG